MKDPSAKYEPEAPETPPKGEQGPGRDREERISQRRSGSFDSVDEEALDEVLDHIKPQPRKSPSNAATSSQTMPDASAAARSTFPLTSDEQQQLRANSSTISTESASELGELPTPSPTARKPRRASLSGMLSTSPVSPGSGGIGAPRRRSSLQNLAVFRGISRAITGLNQAAGNATCIADLSQQSVFDFQAVGLTALAVGPFQDGLSVIHIAPESDKELRVGRFDDFSSLANHIEFQDYSVAKVAGKISFRSFRKTFALEGGDSSRDLLLAVPESSPNYTEDCIKVKDGEDVPLQQGCAIRFGEHSWLTIMPFAANTLVLYGDVAGNKLSLTVKSGRTFIGSGHRNDYCVPAEQVAEQHIMVERTENGFLVVDLSTQTGTFINGIRLNPPTGMLLFPGAKISLGDPKHGHVFVAHFSVERDQNRKIVGEQDQYGVSKVQEV